MNYIVVWNRKKREFDNYGEALSTAFDLTYSANSAESDIAIIIVRDLWILKLVTYYDVEGTPVWNVVEI